MAALIFLFFSSNGLAQNEASKWYFGFYSGLDFMTSPPTILTNGVLSTDEGCASISDATGNILFYTDESSVYNQQHLLMANGSGLFGNGSSTQSAIIIKRPGSANLYFIFTEDATAGANGLCYSVVDMNLAAGMGSVTVKNFTLFSPSSEKIAAVRHCNGNDLWVVSHDWNSNNFRSYLVTNSGVSSTAVLSSMGPNLSGSSANTYGQIKFSPNGKKIGIATYGVGTLELYDFDAASGLVSNPFLIGTFANTYGCEFSPDGTKFYGAIFYQGNQIMQWNLCAGSNTAIIASQVTIPTSTTNYIGSFQLAPNGKIYIARTSSSFLSVIDSPNSLGTSCNYIDNGQSVGTKTCQSGLPNFVSSFFKHAPTPFTYSSNCQNVSFSASASQSTVNSGCSFATNSVISTVWDFGEPNSAANNSSTLSNPSHTYAATGSYTVRLIVNYSCSADTLIQPITLTALNFSLSGFSTVCAKDVRTYTASGASSYSWSTGAITPTITITTSVTSAYTVTGIGTGTNPCKANKVFTVTVAKCTGIEAEDAGETFFKVFPNPTHGILNKDADKDVRVVITNALGQVLLDKSFEAGNHNLDISAYRDGIYFVKATSGTRSKITRLVKAE